MVTQGIGDASSMHGLCPRPVGAQEKGSQSREFPQSPSSFPEAARIAWSGSPLVPGRRRRQSPGPRYRLCRHGGAWRAGSGCSQRVGPQRGDGGRRMGPGRLHDDAGPRRVGVVVIGA